MNKSVEIGLHKLVERFVDEYDAQLNDLIQDIMENIGHDLETLGIEEEQGSIIVNAILHMLSSEIAFMIAALTQPSSRKALRSVEKIIKLGIEQHRQTIAEALERDEDEDEEDDE